MAKKERSTPTATRPVETMLTPTEAAIFLGIHRNTLRAWRNAGTGPAYVQHTSRTIRYQAADLLSHQAEASPT